MLGLAKALRPGIESEFLSFSEEGRCRQFLDRAINSGFSAFELRHDFPRLLAASKEIQQFVAAKRIDILLAHGYKATAVGLWVARRAAIPIIAVSRGWTSESFRVRVYELFDRQLLRQVDRVVCVSHAQAEKVQNCNVHRRKIVVIHNAVDPNRFNRNDPGARQVLEGFFPQSPGQIVVAAGRLSPEKAFHHLVDAAREVCRQRPGVGFLLFGEGGERERLTHLISQSNLCHHVVLAGHRSDLDKLLPHADLFVQSSLTEGMPNVILEALAARVPVIATDVGGTREIVEHQKTGILAPAGDAKRLAQHISDLINDGNRRAAFSSAGYEKVCTCFSFTAQAVAYRELLLSLVSSHFQRDGRDGRISSPNGNTDTSMSDQTNGAAFTAERVTGRATGNRKPYSEDAVAAASQVKGAIG